MAETRINVRLADDIALPYEAGAEKGLQDDLAAAWQVLVNAFPGITLDPLFSSVDVSTLTDMVDAARMSGEEPPNPLDWFEIPCDDSVIEALLPLVLALPFVVFADVRPQNFVAGLISFGTNPETDTAIQLLPGPLGVDAIRAWNIAGGTGAGIRLADIEGAWWLDHDDLITASITQASVFGSEDADHGTAVLGVAIASDNGVGLVGIAPEASAFLVTEQRANGVPSMPAALVAAGAAAQPGGVVLIELAANFFAGASEPAILVETDRPTQDAIRLLTLFGITVVEPAGNSGIDLDQFPFFAQVQPGSPDFIDSGAIVVGGADLVATAAVDDSEWSRGSSFGARVDCFGPFSGIRSPSADAHDAYQMFGGTSGASAIMAGVVCAIQGMAQAATGQPLAPGDIRRLLRDPDLGTPTGPTRPGGIGSMPDLRKIARNQGWARILPGAALATADDSFTVVKLDDDDHLVQRTWSAGFGLGDEALFPAPNDTFVLAPQTPAFLSTLQVDPTNLTVNDVLAIGSDGSVRHLWWDFVGDVGDLTFERAAAGTLAPGKDLSAVRPTADILTILGVDPASRLVAMAGDASIHLGTGLSAPVVIDPAGSYSRTAGPMLVSSAPTFLDAVAIDDGGNIRWIRGSAIATIGTGWQAPLSSQADVSMEPKAKPGVVGTDSGAVIVAVGTDGLLYYCAFALQPLLFESASPISRSVTFAKIGPVGLGLTGDNTIVAAAVGSDGLLYYSFRKLAPGGAWSAFGTIDSDVSVSPLGGVTVIIRGTRIMVAAILPDGSLCRSDYLSGTGWTPLRTG